MKKRERTAALEQMRGYVAMLQPLLRLSHWEIAVADDEPEGGALADNCCYMRQYKNDIHLSTRLLRTSPAEQRETVVHELLHIVVEHWYRSNLAAFEALSATSQEWARDRQEHEMEMAVDTLSKILAPFLPLPPVAEKGDTDGEPASAVA